MLHLRLKEGAPDEPDTGDYDAICATPSPEAFFGLLFREVAGFSLPAAVITSETEDDIRRTQTGCCGSPALGVEVTVVTCTETSDFPVYCYWETHGLPGMTVKWDYALEYAGQLGHTAFRHTRLECTFDTLANQQRFAELWRRIIGKDPVFEPI